LKFRVPTIGRPTLTLLACLWLVATCNFQFWRTVWAGIGGLRPDNVLFVVSLPVVALAWTFLLLSLFSWGRAAKAVLFAFLLVSAAIGYFANTYGVLIDHVMIANIVQTDPAEAFDLMSWGLAAWLLALGIGPAVLVARAPTVDRPWKRELAAKALGML